MSQTSSQQNYKALLKLPLVKDILKACKRLENENHKLIKKNKKLRDKNHFLKKFITTFPEFRYGYRENSIRIPNIPIKDSDIFAYPLFGDRFDTIANRYYGDSNLWWIIAKANEISNGKLSPDPLKKLRIPTEIDDIIEAINNSN